VSNAWLGAWVATQRESEQALRHEFELLSARVPELEAQIVAYETLDSLGTPTRGMARRASATTSGSQDKRGVAEAGDGAAETDGHDAAGSDAGADDLSHIGAGDSEALLLSHELVEAKLRIEKLESRLATAQHSEQVAVDKAGAATGVTSRLQDRIDTLLAELREAQVQHRRLEDRAREAEAAAARATADAQSHMEAAQHEVAEAVARAQAADGAGAEALAEAAEQVAAAEKRVQAAIARAEKAEQEPSGLQTALAMAQGDAEAAKEARGAAELRCEEATSVAQVANDNRAAAEAALADARAALAAQRARCAELEDLCSSLRQQVSVAERNLACVREGGSSTVKQSSAAVRVTSKSSSQARVFGCSHVGCVWFRVCQELEEALAHEREQLKEALETNAKLQAVSVRLWGEVRSAHKQLEQVRAEHEAEKQDIAERLTMQQFLQVRGCGCTVCWAWCGLTSHMCTVVLPCCRAVHAASTDPDPVGRATSP